MTPSVADQTVVAPPAVADAGTHESGGATRTSEPVSPPRVAPYRVEVFYDGDCPLCLREINLLKWMDRHDRVRFTDIAVEGFDPAVYGKSMDELMAEIHGRLPASEEEGGDAWIIGVEVFRQIYGAIGFGPIVPVTRLPGVRHALDAGYSFFAKRRLWMTGRCGPTDACRVG